MDNIGEGDRKTTYLVMFLSTQLQFALLHMGFVGKDERKSKYFNRIHSTLLIREIHYYMIHFIQFGKTCFCRLGLFEKHIQFYEILSHFLTFIW